MIVLTVESGDGTLYHTRFDTWGDAYQAVLRACVVGMSHGEDDSAIYAATYIPWGHEFSILIGSAKIYLWSDKGAHIGRS